MKKNISWLLTLSMIISLWTVPAAQASDIQPGVKWVSVAHRNGVINIMWENPEYTAGSDEEITKVSLYSLGTSGETLVSDTLSVESKKRQSYRVTGLSNNTEYVYKIKFDYKEENSDYVVVKDIPRSEAAILGNASTSVIAVPDKADGVMAVSIDKDNHTGEGSTSSFKVETITEGADWVDLMQYRDIGVKLGKKYRISFDYKCSGTIAKPILVGGWSTAMYYDGGTRDWKHYSQDFKWAESNYMFIKGYAKGTAWYDNISIYELDDSNNIVGENILEEYSSEKLYEGMGLNAPEITASAGNGSATVNWTDTSGTFMHLFVKKDGALYEKAVVPASDKKFTIEGLENDTEVELVARAEKNGCFTDDSNSEKVTPNAAEPTPSPEPTLPPVTEGDVGEAVSAMTNAGKDTIIVSWRNPEYTIGSATELQNVTLSQKTGGGYEVIKSGFSTASGEAQSYKVQGLSLDTLYSFKLSFEFKNFRTLELFLSDVTTNDSKYLGSGKVKWDIDAAYSSNPFNVTIDDKVFAANSTASMKITANSKANSQYAGIASISWDKISFAKGKKYRISYDYKSSGSKGGIFLLGDWDHVNYIGNGTSSWQHTTQDFEFSVNGNGLFLKLNLPLTCLWIDNLEIFELDSNKNIVGDSLVKEYTAENILALSDTDSIEIEAEAENRGAKLSWNATSSCDKINIYSRVGDNKYLRASVSAKEGQTRIGSLVNGMENELVAVPVKDGIEFDKEFVFSVTPKSSRYETTDFYLFDSDGKPAKPIAGGNYTAEIKIKNNKIDTNFTAQLIVAQFIGNKLVSLNSADVKTIEISDEGGWITDRLCVPFTVKNGVDRVTVYLWDSIDEMTSLKETEEIS